MNKAKPVKPVAGRVEDPADYREAPLRPDAPEDASEPELAGEEAFEQRAARVTVAQHGVRLDKCMVALAPEFSRNHLQDLIERGHVQVDGVVSAVPSRKLKSGQQVSVELVPTAESLAFRPEPMALQILFEDAHMLVLNKPAGVVVHPAAGNWSGTLLNGLLAYHAAAAALPRAGIVHRLDKDTSGLMVVGKTLAAVTALSRAIAGREVHRQYLALAHGLFAQTGMSIDAPIGRDPASRIKMAVVSTGRLARTDVAVLAQEDGVAALQCTLHTGRTHQIRVHLASIGHPLLADAVYGGRPAMGMIRQALHAVRLRLIHPLSGQRLVFECLPPSDFVAAWREVAGTDFGTPV